MTENFSRRKLAGILAGAAAAGTMSAQQQPAAPVDAEIDAARSRQRASSFAIAQIQLTMNIEPAFQFKA